MDKAPRVFLVGAGPGDPELLTIKALRLLQSANAVVYDRLVSDEIIDLIPKGVTKIYVGKRCGRHFMTQDQINDLLVRLVQKNHRLVRLKGGDPFMFGRGGEEAQALASHGIDFEVIPGITSASACSTYAGIPLAHRGLSHGVQYITGHCGANKPLDLDWKALAAHDMTLAIYMGLANLPEIVQHLTEAGRSADTPAAIIENGTTPSHRRIVTTLKALPEAAKNNNVCAPAMILIGEVVSLSGALDWFATTKEVSQEWYSIYRAIDK